MALPARSAELPGKSTGQRQKCMELFVHITGSVPRSDGTTTVALSEQTAYETARALLRQQIGVVALVGASPNEATASFDDAIIRAAADHVRDTHEAGIVLRTVRHRTRWQDRISDDTLERLTRLDRHIAGETLPDDEYVGGSIRDAQARLCHGAIIIGGYKGVKETADLLMNSLQPKPVDEIFVKGLTMGLPDDVRAKIDEARNWNGKADQRTVHQESDCARIAHSVADDIASLLRANGAASSAGQDEPPPDHTAPARRWAKMRSALLSNQLANWTGNLLRLIGFLQIGNGG